MQFCFAEIGLCTLCLRKAQPNYKLKFDSLGLNALRIDNADETDAWPSNESEAGVHLVFIETSLLFLCKFPLISMGTASLTLEM